MIQTTPFHPRTSEANQTGLWSHWTGYLSAEKYRMSDKFEYWAIRNSAGVIDTSPLYKYRIRGRDAERYLSGLLTRDIRKCRPGQAQYTVWCDDDGWVLEDGVILRLADDEFLLTTARANMAYFTGMAEGLSVEIEDASPQIGALAVQGPYARQILSQIAPEMADLAYFGVTPAKFGDASVTISRTGYTGDLGYEIWVDADDAVGVWDRLFDVAEPYGVIPAGQIALLVTRVEAGLILIDVDFKQARYAWNDDQRATPIELGMGWMIRDLAEDDRPFIGRKAIEKEIAGKTSRWRTVGVIADWQDWNRVYMDRGLVPEKDHSPNQGQFMLYDRDDRQIGWTPSFLYSPIMQRHIGIARVEPEHGRVGTKIQLEITIDHRYDMVAAEVTRLPFYNPPHKTA